jgi:bacterioferritin-associated ferredoxin
MILIRAMLGRMYVCICNGHRDRDIREAAKTGLRCAVEIYKHLGKPPRCGRCLDLAAQVIAEVHDRAEPETPGAAARLAS